MSDETQQKAVSDKPASPRKKAGVRKFEAAARQELKAWRRISKDHEGLILAFCWCVAQRLDGKDPDEVLAELTQKKEGN
jgi:hypothetical protein